MNFLFWFWQVSNGPITSNSSPISSNSAQSGLTSKTTTNAKASSPGKQTPSHQQQQQHQQSPAPQQTSSSPPLAHQQSSPQSLVLPSTPAQTKQSTPLHNAYTQPPLTTLANGFGPSMPAISTSHSISASHIASPITNQTSITNGSSTASAPSTHPSAHQATAPICATSITATPSTHSNDDKTLTTNSLRTTSPATAIQPSAGPIVNGNSPVIPGMPNGSMMSPYRSGYPPPYPLYPPYGGFHHGNPYIPPAITSPSQSPRPTDARMSRESSLIAANGIRPMTPTAATAISQNGISIAQMAAAVSSASAQHGSHSTSAQQQQSQSQSQSHPASHSTVLSLQKSQSPRGPSPSRERESYR